MFISLSEYARLHGKNPESARKRAARGGFQTARKEGRSWIIDSEEPYDDLRQHDTKEPDMDQLVWALPKTEQAAKPVFRAALFDELTPIYPDTDVRTGEDALTVSGANGTYVGVHIALSGLTPGIPVTFSVEGPHRAYKLFELIPVPVEVNTGAVLRSEYLKNDKNENVIRRAPFYIYEALKPIFNLARPQYTTAAFAFRTPIEYCRKKETASFTIKICHDGMCRTLTVQTMRYPVTVKPAAADSPQFVNWFDYENISLWHNAPMWSARYEEMLTRYLRTVRYLRQNIMAIPGNLLFTVMPDGSLRFEPQRLDLMLRAAKRAGITLFQGGAFCSRASSLADNDDFYASLDHDSFTSPEQIGEAFKRRAFDEFDYGTDAVFSLTGASMSSEQGQSQLKEALCTLYGYLRAHNLCDVWTQSCLDEPNDALCEVYHTISKITREAMPGIPVLEPVLPTENVIGALDIWCPSLDIYEKNQAFFDKRVEEGDKLYVYSCLTPGGNYCNRLLDMERLRVVYLAWGMMKYPNIMGFLHWGANFTCGNNPFERQAAMFSEQVMEYHPKYANFLPAGDECILYPGFEQPLSSTRAEAHRIGFEDLELLRMLKQTNPARADEIVSMLFTRFDCYEKSVKEYRRVRTLLLEAVCESK